MSLLNQLFNRGLLGAKCKTCLTLAISRIKLLQNKRDAQVKVMRKEIAQFLQAGQEPIARIRVEHVIREQNMWAAYEILELFCEFVLARVPILESQRECPSELREAIASIIFAAPRCSDLPDLLHVRNLFAAKYGKDFISAASELRPDTSVNRTIIEKLSIGAPSAEVRLKEMKEIAREYNLEWDSSQTEAEFSKKPEDLLNGPKPISGRSRLIQALEKQDTSGHQQIEKKHRIISTKVRKDTRSLPSPILASKKTLSGPEETGLSVENHTSPRDNAIKETGSQSSDVMERARVAIAAADRASAAAHAAAELVNVKFTTLKLGE